MNNVGLVVDDLEAPITCFVERGAELEAERAVEMVQYEGQYPLCSVRPAEGISVALAQEIGEGGA